MATDPVSIISDYLHHNLQMLLTYIYITRGSLTSGPMYGIRRCVRKQYIPTTNKLQFYPPWKSHSDVVRRAIKQSFRFPDSYWQLELDCRRDINNVEPSVVSSKRAACFFHSSLLFIQRQIVEDCNGEIASSPRITMTNLSMFVRENITTYMYIIHFI